MRVLFYRIMLVCGNISIFTNPSFPMSGIEALQKIVSWSNASEIDGAEREEFNQLVNGRSMIYAQVENHKTKYTHQYHLWLDAFSSYGAYVLVLKVPLSLNFRSYQIFDHNKIDDKIDTRSGLRL